MVQRGKECFGEDGQMFGPIHHQRNGQMMEVEWIQQQQRRQPIAMASTRRMPSNSNGNFMRQNGGEIGNVVQQEGGGNRQIGG
jgi:hypothetical protein